MSIIHIKDIFQEEEHIGVGTKGTDRRCRRPDGGYKGGAGGVSPQDHCAGCGGSGGTGYMKAPATLEYNGTTYTSYTTTSYHQGGGTVSITLVDI